MKVSCLLVGGPFPCADEVGSNPDRFDVPLVGIVEYKAVDGGPIARGALLVEVLVDVKAGVSVDTYESIAVGPDDYRYRDSSSRSYGILQGTVGGSTGRSFRGGLQCETDALVVEHVAVLLKGDLDSWIFSVEVDLVCGDEAVCALHGSLTSLDVVGW